MLRLCDKAHLKKLAKAVKDSTKGSLRPFFTMKTHKEEKPFRLVIEDKALWQFHVALFLQQHLSVLPIEDPYLIQNSKSVVDFLDEGGKFVFVSGRQGSLQQRSATRGAARS